MDDAFYNWLADMCDQGIVTKFDLDQALNNERAALRLLRDFLIDERDASVAFVRNEAKELLKVRLLNEGIIRALSEEGESDD